MNEIYDDRFLPELELLNRLIGERIAQVRREQGISLKTLGQNIMRVTGQQVSRYERGLSRVPVADLLQLLLKAKITPNDFAIPVMNTLLWYQDVGYHKGIDPKNVHLGMELLFVKKK